MVHEIVGRINGQFGTLTYVPICHLDTSLSFTELCALYAITDVVMVTSLRDGMNLVGWGSIGGMASRGHLRQGKGGKWKQWVALTVEA